MGLSMQHAGRTQHRMMWDVWAVQIYVLKGCHSYKLLYGMGGLVAYLNTVCDGFIVRFESCQWWVYYHILILYVNPYGIFMYYLFCVFCVFHELRYCTSYCHFC
jgi:hypothetical protein